MANKPHQFTEQDDAELTLLHEDGASLLETARLTGLRSMQVWRRWNHLGLPTEPAARARLAAKRKHDPDWQFQRAMRAAIRSGGEHASIGIDTTPGTVNPIVMRHVPYVLSGCTSPAAACADFITPQLCKFAVA